MRRLLSVALLISGCAAVPTAPQPTPSLAAVGSFVEARTATVSQAPVPEDWWRLFDDPVLDGHVQRALEANSDLRVAFANLDVARASARQANAARRPRAGIESGRGSTNAVDQPSTTMVPTSDYDVGATVAYEVDLFGRLRSAALAARADAEASAAALDAARVAVAADTVAAYVDLCGAIAQARVAEDTVALQRRSAELVARQLRHGEVSPLELAQAQTELRRAEAAAPQFEADRRRALFRLAALQGRAPAEADSIPVGCTAPPRIATPIPVGDGATLIARRPDIREADRRIVAATARIGVATADLYPRISIGGSGGLISGGLDAFVTPLISWAFLDRSAVRAKIAAARGNEAAALAAWDTVMLRALREVESALANFSAEGIRRKALAAALAESDKALHRVRSRHRLGADNYLLVLDAQRSRNDIFMQLASADLRIAQTQVEMFRALGGGWQEPQPK